MLRTETNNVSPFRALGNSDSLRGSPSGCWRLELVSINDVEQAALFRGCNDPHYVTVWGSVVDDALKLQGSVSPKFDKMEMPGVRRKAIYS